MRLYKYLIPQYYEDFKQSADEWAKIPSLPAAAAESSAPSGLPAAATGGWADLRELYTEHVVPKELDNWESFTPNQRSDFVLKKLLHVDHHPTLSRFFVYLQNVHGPHDHHGHARLP